MNLRRILLAAALSSGLLHSASGQAPSPPAAPSSSDDLSSYTTADALWFHIQDLKRPPSAAPSDPQQAQELMSNTFNQIYDDATAFVTRYPDDPRKWDARLLQIRTGAALDRLRGCRDDASEGAQLRELSYQPDAPASIRAEARFDFLGVLVRNYGGGNNTVNSAEVLAQLKQFINDFPTYPSLDLVKYQVSQVLKSSDPADSDALLRELANSGEGKIPDLARAQLSTRDRLKSPLDLRFTAVDGSQVDLSQMRGKVVLVDFWATWSGPSEAGIPEVVATYNKLHGKGFEVIGISLDMQKENLLDYTAGHGMPWPQYFDGKEWQNAIAASFGIESIPTMWLVNKKGYVVDTNARADLEGMVEKLLAE